MARIPLTETHQIDSDAAAVFAEVGQALGRVPNVFRAYAHHPPLLRANWEKVKSLMLGGQLDRRLKEAIAVAVSGDNGCEYCIAAHGQALRDLGTPDEVIEALREGEETTGFDDREATLLGFIRKANRSALTVTDDDVRAVREAGWRDQELVEALGVMELFTGINRFLDSLRIEIDV